MSEFNSDSLGNGHGTADKSLLGKETRYDHDYDPSLLFPIPRAENRAKLDLGGPLPFKGEDVWMAFELSWLDSKGKPKVAIAEFRIPVESPFMIESKSFKLYLNSLNHKHFTSESDLQKCVVEDLSAAAGANVSVEIHSARQGAELGGNYGAVCIDDIDCTGFEYQPNAALLRTLPEGEVQELVYSELLRSNCPVTGQPDWATVFIKYRGKPICHESLLRYIVSFRQCQDFHEHCVERIFVDLKTQCQCESLTVYARYTRRGGLDINPYRTDCIGDEVAPSWRTARQ